MKNLPGNLLNCTILDRWVFENFMLAGEPFKIVSFAFSIMKNIVALLSRFLVKLIFYIAFGSAYIACCFYNYILL